jgi:mRNA-degrading endonuclease RelE of RelBE toxin-antitoxin system
MVTICNLEERAKHQVFASRVYGKWCGNAFQRVEQPKGHTGQYQIRQRVRRGLTELAGMENPLEHQSVKRLTGDLRGFYRLGVGKYRIVLAIVGETRTIAVANIAPRGDVYK